ncbi:MAG: hypothetical protein VX278_05295, partial [Myxococcota bacterium]|nr:hypothetical protein [Myxococcota bacterium]
LRETPTYRQPVGENGLWGPFEIETDVPYEFRLMPNGEQIVHHFYRPISHENHFMRLRAKPTEGLAGQLLASIPFENQNSLSLVTYSKASALRSGRDSLTIDGEELLTNERASKEDTIVAMFHFDYDEDLQSGDDPNIFSFFPYFLGATDHYWDSSIETPLSINLNGNLLNIPRYGDGILLITL